MLFVSQKGSLANTTLADLFKPHVRAYPFVACGHRFGGIRAVNATMA
jgi:hypothetical protein